jgi:hypothetical protein
MQQEKDQETTWYHEGPEALQVARLWIASEQICVRVCVHARAHLREREHGCTCIHTQTHTF